MSSKKTNAEELVAVVGHLLGFRSGPDGRLLGNENVTKAQRSGTSTSNLENVFIKQKLGSGPAQWEAGALVDVAGSLGMIDSEEELKRLKQKFPRGGRDGSGCLQNNDRDNKKPQGNDNGASTDDRRARTGPAEFSKGPGGFFPPRKVEAKSDGNNQSLGNSYQERFIQSGRIQNNGHDGRVGNAPVSKSSLFNSVTATATQATGRLEPRTSIDNGPGTQQSSNHSRGPSNVSASSFKTAYEQLKIDDKMKGIQRSLPRSDSSTVHATGLRRPNNREPVKSAPPAEETKPKFSENPEVEEIMSHESMGNIDPKMVEAILNEVVQTTSTNWNDIAGLEGVKAIIKEVIIWPMRRPDIFTGLRASPRGILFFGPPGTGKTMFGRVIANQFNSTFFNISASSLTSKWIGDGEKMVRALFAVARIKQPAVIFIDEIDSILTQRSETEHESSRRLKTEFLIQFDGCATQSEERILVIGVTNRPQELDEAARRRFVKRIYIPLPDFEGRKQLVRNLLQKYSTELSDDEYNEIAQMTEGYSGADMTSLCREAAYGPIREVGHLLDSIDPSQVRPMQMKDFKSAQRQVKSSVALSDVALYEEWDTKFGCHI